MWPSLILCLDGVIAFLNHTGEREVKRSKVPMDACREDGDGGDGGNYREEGPPGSAKVLQSPTRSEQNGSRMLPRSFVLGRAEGGEIARRILQGEVLRASSAFPTTQPSPSFHCCCYSDAPGWIMGSHIRPWCSHAGWGGCPTFLP